jgi:hypothetical protein
MYMVTQTPYNFILLQYELIVRKYIFYLNKFFLDTGRKGSHFQAFLVCFTESANTFYFYRQCMYIVIILQC